MKKVYLAPQTEAVQMLGENAIMAASGTGSGVINLYGGPLGGIGTGSGSGTPQ